jgi:hypothetical protein
MPQSRKTPSRRPPAARKRATPAPPAPPADDEALRRRLTTLRDMLTRSVMLSNDGIRETLDDAVRRGRMTRADAEELATRLVALGRKGAEDAMADLDRLLAGGRVGRAAGAASDRVLREVDRARRAAGLGSPFPISGYDELTAAQISSRLGELTPAELRKVRDYEKRNANRKSVLSAVDKKLG